MKAQLRTTALAVCLLAPAGALIGAPAMAAPHRAAATPQLQGLEINADSGLASGSQLQFTLQGSPRGRATARITSLNIDVPLKETSPGVYEGMYTVRRADRIDPSSVVRASLTNGNRTITSNYSFPPSFNAAAPALQIERFVVLPIDRVEPGAELRFRLSGRPNSIASVDIPNIVSNIPLREVRPGQYEGTYTVRRQDNVAAAGPVTATLRSGPNVVTAGLNRPLIQDASAPVIGNLMPRNGEVVTGGVATVGGTFDDAGGTGVDPRSVRIVISGRDVTGDAQITPRQFSYRTPLLPGRHTVEVSAKDRVGNVTQKTWAFDVGVPMGAAPALMPLPLQVLSHPANASVSGPTQINGRTAPGAMVQVKVDAVPPVIGDRAGVATRLLTQTVQADANGDFSFNFAPRIPIPGMRYDVQLNANSGPQNTESKISLFQRG